MKSKRKSTVVKIAVGLLVSVIMVACLVDFEDPALNTIYYVGDTFTDSGVTITVLPFQWGNNTWTSGGYCKIVTGGSANGSGQEILVNNVNLGFDFGSEMQELSYKFGEYGGNINTEVNDDFVNVANFSNLPAVLGGLNVTVVNGLGNDAGTVDLQGTVPIAKFDFSANGVSYGEFHFVVGGQELLIDDVNTN